MSQPAPWGRGLPWKSSARMLPTGAPPSIAVAPVAYVAPAPARHDAAYHLDAGDKLRVVVYGQEGLTNTYAVSAGGSITMPGTAILSGLTYPTADGTAGQVITTDGNGALTFTTVSGGGSPAGSNTEIQFNNNGSFGASSQLTFNSGTNTLQGATFACVNLPHTRRRTSSSSTCRASSSSSPFPSSSCASAPIASSRRHERLSPMLEHQAAPLRAAAVARVTKAFRFRIFVLLHARAFVMALGGGGTRRR